MIRKKMAKLYNDRAKKENYLNDNARSVSTNSKQVVMTNAGSYCNYNNQSVSTKKFLIQCIISYKMLIKMEKLF